jgi:FKBP-type peptidyl-prolyl cis-trans isomerase FklB
MKVGERWEVYIPWQQGYGSSVSGTIPAYSTLIFDVNLVSIIKK